MGLTHLVPWRVAAAACWEMTGIMLLGPHRSGLEGACPLAQSAAHRPPKVEIWFADEATPAAEATPADQQAVSEVTIPVGPPAGDAIAAGVTLTVHEIFSCFAAGDFRRATALFTDDLVRQFGPGPEETEEDVIAFLEATPVPAAEDQGTEFGTGGEEEDEE